MKDPTQTVVVSEESLEYMTAALRQAKQVFSTQDSIELSAEEMRRFQYGMVMVIEHIFQHGCIGCLDEIGDENIRANALAKMNK